MVCPLHKKSMAKVCHECPWWQRVQGKNPQTGADIDHYECAIALLPMLMVNVAKEAMQTAAAVESFRNETARAADAALAIDLARMPRRIGAG